MPTQTRSHTFVGNMDGLGNTAEFEIEITASTGSPTLNRQKVEWTEQTIENTILTYPAVVAYFEQRLVFGSYTHNKQLLRFSQTGDFHSFDASRPARDDDALDLTIASLELDEIRGLVPLEELVVLTAGAEWTLAGAEGGPLTPVSFDAKPRSYYGAQSIMPLAIGNAVLFWVNGGKSLREFRRAEFNQPTPRDLAILARHLFKAGTVFDWCYADNPDQVVWCVRDDGDLLGLTYVPEHEVWAWHRHTTPGNFESVVALPESGNDILYAVVSRLVNSATKRYVEYQDPRTFTDIEDAVFVDSALTYDGRNTSAVQLKLTDSGGSAYQVDELMTLTADTASTFVAGDVGAQYTLEGADGSTCLVVATAYGSGTTMTVRALETVPASLQDTYTSTWSKGVTTLSGLDHLEGRSVVPFIDGNVHDPVTVSSGAITLTEHAVRACVGLAYESEIQTLALETPDSRVRMNTKTAPYVGLEVDEWRGLVVGTEPSNLVIAQTLEPSVVWGAIPLDRRLVRVAVPRGWKRNLTIYAKQTDPLPVTIVSLIPEVEVGG